MGRCADYVLEGMEGLVRVFIYADRISGKNAPLKKNITAAKMQRKVKAASTGSCRDYFRYYTGKEWEFPENYDL